MKWVLISDESVASFQKTAVAVLALLAVFLKTAVAVVLKLTTEFQHNSNRGLKKIPQPKQN